MSTVGVTGTRANVSGKVQSLLQDIKKVCNCIVLSSFFNATYSSFSPYVVYIGHNANPKYMDFYRSQKNPWQLALVCQPLSM